MSRSGSTGPDLRTSRLYLRPFGREHVPALLRHWRDRDVRRYLWDGRVIDRQTAEAVVEQSIEDFAERRFGMWGLYRCGDPALIGFCGLRRFDEPPDVELLYGLAPSHWGLGLANEAASAVLDYGFALPLQAIFAGADPPNTASIPGHGAPRNDPPRYPVVRRADGQLLFRHQSTLGGVAAWAAE